MLKCGFQNIEVIVSAKFSYSLGRCIFITKGVRKFIVLWAELIIKRVLTLNHKILIISNMPPIFLHLNITVLNICFVFFIYKCRNPVKIQFAPRFIIRPNKNEVHTLPENTRSLFDHATIVCQISNNRCDFLLSRI